jgi:hypothetical protein
MMDRSTDTQIFLEDPQAYMNGHECRYNIVELSETINRRNMHQSGLDYN